MTSLDKMREALDALDGVRLGGPGTIRHCLTEARAALDELAAQLSARTAEESGVAPDDLPKESDSPPIERPSIESLRLIARALRLADEVPTLQNVPKARRDYQALLMYVNGLESQLSAQPKALEWREPSTAPLEQRLLFLVRERGACLGERRALSWVEDWAEGINQGAWEHAAILGWLPLDALPPAPKGGSDG
jgi:hypothetical protein